MIDIGDPERIKMAKRFFIYLFTFFLLLKTRTKKIIASSRRSRTVDSGEVISEVEAVICNTIGSINVLLCIRISQLNRKLEAKRSVPRYKYYF